MAEELFYNICDELADITLLEAFEEKAGSVCMNGFSKRFWITRCPDTKDWEPKSYLRKLSYLLHLA